MKLRTTITFLAMGICAICASDQAPNLNLTGPNLSGLRGGDGVVTGNEYHWATQRRSDRSLVAVTAMYTKSRTEMLALSDPQAGNMERVDPTYHDRSPYTNRKLGDGCWVEVRKGFVNTFVRSGLNVYRGYISKQGPRHNGSVVNLPITKQDVATVEDLTLAAMKVKPKKAP